MRMDKKLLNIGLKMGKKYYDKNTLTHFITGFISRLVVFPQNPTLSLATTNVVHLMIEMVEHDEHPNDKSVETPRNHVGDCIFFAMGWFLMNIIVLSDGGRLLHAIRMNKPFHSILLLAVGYAVIKEVAREVFPHHNWKKFI